MLKPHPDIELGTKREEIDAYITLPEAGINEETGVILVLGELGETAESALYEMEVRPFLADKLNCVAVGVNYFGIFRNSQITIMPSLLNNLNRIYGLSLNAGNFSEARGAEDVYRIIAEQVVRLGVTSVDLRCQPQLVTGRGEYQSWGFLPAIDCLQVLGEVIQRFQLNTKRVMAYGSHYGAYIASLAAKYAPMTFSTIIDWEGYTHSELRHIISGELMETDYLFHFDLNNGIKFYIASTCNNPWTILNEASPAYFSDSHRKIRSLLCESHRIPSPTKYYIAHSEDDQTSPLYEKDQCVDILRNYNQVTYRRFEAGEGVGIMNYRQIFAWLTENDWNYEKDEAETDFSQGSNYLFVCGDKSYRFVYSDNGGINVSIE